MLKNGTRVVGIPGGDSRFTGRLGTVVDVTDSAYLVRWDGDEIDRVMPPQYIMDHQELKRLFKHGSKLTKKGLLA